MKEKAKCLALFVAGALLGSVGATVALLKLFNPTHFQYITSTPLQQLCGTVHVQLAEYKGGQNWIIVDKDKVKFPGGGTKFIHGADQ